MSEEITQPLEPAVIEEPVTAVQWSALLKGQAERVAAIERSISIESVTLSTANSDRDAAISALLTDPALVDHPQVVALRMANAMQTSTNLSLESLSKRLAEAKELLKSMALEAAPVILPTIEDKTLLRNTENKAVITIATKRKETAWDPTAAYVFASSSESTKHYVVSMVDEKRFKADVEKGFIKPPPGVYEFSDTFEYRLMSEAILKL